MFVEKAIYIEQELDVNVEIDIDDLILSLHTLNNVDLADLAIAIQQEKERRLEVRRNSDRILSELMENVQ